MDNKKVAIILLNWNNSNDTIECIKSILNNNVQSFRIIVIDNASKPEDLRSLENFVSNYSDIIDLKKNKVNLGFSRAHNIIFNSYLRNEEFIWILNNDTIILKNSLSELISFLEMNTSIDIAGSVMTYYNSPNLIQSYGGGKYYPFLGLSKLLYKNSPLSKLKSLKHKKKPDYLMGSSLLIRRDSLKKLKGFDNSFFVYGEDLDFSLRAQKEGMQIAVCTESIVLHKDSGSTKGKKNLFYYLLFKGNILNTKKHYPHFLLIATLVNILSLLLRTRNFKNLKGGIKGIIDGIIQNQRK